MDPKFLASMYNSSPKALAKPTKESPDKRATRVLGGMKIHGTHMKQLEVDGEIIDIPRAAYIKLLEEQIRELRKQVNILTEKNSRMNNTVKRMYSEFREELRGIHIELDRKIDMR